MTPMRVFCSALLVLLTIAFIAITVRVPGVIVVRFTAIASFVLLIALAFWYLAQPATHQQTPSDLPDDAPDIPDDVLAAALQSSIENSVIGHEDDGEAVDLGTVQREVRAQASKRRPGA